MTAAPESAPQGPLVHVVGIGEDGWDGLSQRARELIAAAPVLIGGARHLALAQGGPARPDRERREWPSPMAALVDEIAASPRPGTVVLASGDPSFYGVAGLLAARMGAGALDIVPHVSSVQLACARLGWALQDCIVVSLCGRSLDTLRAELFDGARLLVLSADDATPGAVAALLERSGFGASRVHVMERLGGPGERIVNRRAGERVPDERFAELNILALELAAGPQARVWPRVPGLAEEAFQHDGQITRAEVRAVALARLGPVPGALLWDIGAGSGSVGVEWMRAAPRARAIGIEPRADRAARARRNAHALGVPAYTVIEGRAPEALSGLAPPDAVFIGGGLTVPGLFEAAWDALAPGGRLVANAVTLESEARLLALAAAHGGDLTRISLARAEPVGRMTGWRPAMPVTQWAVTKRHPQ